MDIGKYLTEQQQAGDRIDLANGVQRHTGGGPATTTYTPARLAEYNKYLGRCATCHGAGLVERDRYPATRTACADCGSTGKRPTDEGFQLLALMRHVEEPTVQPSATPEAIRAFNQDAQAQHEARLAADRAEAEKKQRASRIRDLLATADPEALERALKGETKPSVRK